MGVPLDAGIGNIVCRVEELDVTYEFKELCRLRLLPARCRLGGSPVAIRGFACDVSIGLWLRRSRTSASRHGASDDRIHARERIIGPQRLTATSAHRDGRDPDLGRPR
jgi:hypothetical protein